MKRVGRPPLDDDDPSVKVSFSLPSRKYDAICAQALRDHISVPEVIRRELDEKNTKK
jgi:hypothetical protein